MSGGGVVKEVKFLLSTVRLFLEEPEAGSGRLSGKNGNFFKTKL